MDEQDGKFAMTHEQALRERQKDQAVSHVTAVVILAIGFAAAYWVWPSGIIDLTLASIAFGGLLRAAASGLIGLVSLVFAVMMWFD